MSCCDFDAKYLDREERGVWAGQIKNVSWRKWILNQSLRKERSDIRIGGEGKDSKQKEYPSVTGVLCGELLKKRLNDWNKYVRCDLTMAGLGRYV